MVFLPSRIFSCNCYFLIVVFNSRSIRVRKSGLPFYVQSVTTTFVAMGMAPSSAWLDMSPGPASRSPPALPPLTAGPPITISSKQSRSFDSTSMMTTRPRFSRQLVTAFMGSYVRFLSSFLMISGPNTVLSTVQHQGPPRHHQYRLQDRVPACQAVVLQRGRTRGPPTTRPRRPTPPPHHQSLRRSVDKFQSYMFLVPIL